MARERLNAVDVAAVVGNLRKLILDYNLVNIYDVTNRVFVLKFSRNEDKKFVLFEIGTRIHTTQFIRSTDHLPSNFNVKLRKHLKTRKLRDVAQIAQDRVVDFTFSSSEYAYHLIVQFFLPGNVYLTDYTYKVLAVLRPHNAGEAFFKVGEIYEIPETSVPWNVPLTLSVVGAALRHMRATTGTTPYFGVINRAMQDGTEGSTAGNIDGNMGPQAGENDEEGGETNINDNNTIRALVKAIFPSVHSTLADHVIKESLGDTEGGSRGVAGWDYTHLLQIVEAVRRTVASVSHSEKLVPGFLMRGRQDYEDFSPFDIKPDTERFDDFNDALDAYFTKSEMNKIEKKEQPKKPIKLKKIKDDQDRREMMLERQIERLCIGIELIEVHRSVFDKVLDLLRTLVATGASWRQIMEQMAFHRDCGHHLARHIRSVNIADRLVDVCLPCDDPAFYDDASGFDGNSGKKRSKKERMLGESANNASVTLDYSMTCFQNLEVMYSAKKKLVEKLERTRLGREYALRRVCAEKENMKQKSRGRTISLIKVRRRMWFEKFHWFISSDGYLVLGGRDSTQNELLVKRYLTKGDLYFHADVHGAASCILKNPRQAHELPQQAIEEAACFAMCLSSAWNQKMVVPAWWVHHDQVSRSAPTGEYLPHGSFMIRGKKNYVQPQRLEMAIGIVFHVETPHVYAGDLDPVDGTDSVVPAYSSASMECNQSVQRSSDDSIGSNSGGYNTDDVIENVESTLDDQESDVDPLSDEGYSSNSSCEECSSSSSSDDDEEEEVGEYVESVEFPVDDEAANTTVRFDTTDIAVHPVEVQSESLKKTLGRKATGYPCTGFEASELVEKMTHLGLIDDDNIEVGGDAVRFIEPEKIEHSPESVRKLRQRMPTGIPTNTKKQGPSKFAAMKAARAIKKYGEDDEETQELRRRLTGSKPLKHMQESSSQLESDSVDEPRYRQPFQRGPIKPLDETELTSHMQQFHALCKDPGPEDTIISAIPMCAPYNALKNHPYHLKLVPGNTKKGAIAAQALQHFLKVDSAKDQFLKCITIDQFSLALIENCKIPGSVVGPK